MDQMQADAARQAPSPVPSRPEAPAVPPALRRYLALDDFQAAARRRLPLSIYGFIAGGVERDAALRGNHAAFAANALVWRSLVDTSERTAGASLFGRDYTAPFGIAPMGASAVAAYDADRVLAGGAAASGIPFILSGASLTPMEEVIKVNPAAWFQAYVPGETPRIEPLVERVAAAGFDTFVLTVDVPVSGNRENNVRNGFSIPLRPTPRLAWQGVTHPRWLGGTALRTLRHRGMLHLENMDATRGPPMLSREAVRAFGVREALNWRHVDLVRRRWPGKLVLKGILAAADARLARAAGVDGVIVSNHGGRQLDSAAAPLDMLPGVVAEAGGMTVVLDGAVRRGTDVLKALALGASFVFIGRPFLFAATVAGAPGVRHAVRLLREEIERDMALLGVTRLSELGPDFVRRTHTCP
jgi:L-lactate dehydrogenase (cytochrome)